MPDLDIWASFGNLIMATCEENNPKRFWAYTLREEDKKYPYLFRLKGKSDLTQAYFLSMALGFVLFYLSNITGRMANLENYFFNDKI